jgi:hypothetical protein
MNKKPQFRSSLSSIIMSGSKPLLTVSTADISVFTLQRLYTLPIIRVSLDARVCKALKHFQGEWQGFTTRPLQRFPNL